MATRREHREAMREQFGDLVTVSQAARYMGIDPRTARKYIEAHEIEPTRIGGRDKFSVIDLAKCLAT